MKTLQYDFILIVTYLSRHWNRVEKGRRASVCKIMRVSIIQKNTAPCTTCTLQKLHTEPRVYYEKKRVRYVFLVVFLNIDNIKKSGIIKQIQIPFERKITIDFAHTLRLRR